MPASTPANMEPRVTPQLPKMIKVERHFFGQNPPIMAEAREEPQDDEEFRGPGVSSEDSKNAKTQSAQDDEPFRAVAAGQRGDAQLTNQNAGQARGEDGPQRRGRDMPALDDLRRDVADDLGVEPVHEQDERTQDGHTDIEAIDRTGINDGLGIYRRPGLALDAHLVSLFVCLCSWICRSDE